MAKPTTITDVEKRLRERELRLAERKVDLEHERDNKIIAQKEIELKLRIRELDFKEKSTLLQRWSSPLMLTLAAAVIALFANGLVAAIKGFADHSIAVEKSQSEIILAALSSEDTEKVKENLRLLAKTNLIRNASSRDAIIEYLNKLAPGQGPGVDTSGKQMPADTDISTMDFLTQASNSRRNLKFARSVLAGKQPISVVGDSWLQYPVVLKDIGDNLAEDYAVFSLAYPGHTLSDAINQNELIPGNAISAIVSLGMDDLFTVQPITNFLRSNPDENGSYLTESFSSKLDIVRANYRLLVSRMLFPDTDLQLILHGYDYFVPANGRIIGQSMNTLGITDPEIQATIIRDVMDAFNEIPKALADEFERVHYVDLRGTLGSTDWRDELHPTSNGFQRISLRLLSKLREVTNK